MPHLVNDIELRNVSALPPAERYGHFVRQVSDWEEIWSIQEDGGWVLLGDPQGRECVPVWPHARYAKAFAQETFPGGVAQSIELAAFLERWLPGIERDGRLVAVFPALPSNGVVVEAGKLATDIREELENYE